MKIEPATCPQCGQPADATLESVPGWALLQRDADGTFDWFGETAIDWNGQVTVVDPVTHKATVRCSEYHTWEASIYGD
jgi:hypothetical protein